MRNIPRRKENPQSLDSPEGVNSRVPPLLIYTKRWLVGGTRDWAITQLTIWRKKAGEEKRMEPSAAESKLLRNHAQNCLSPPFNI